MSTFHGLNVGDEIDLEVTQKSKDGRGLARFKGLIVFVDGASPGEKVKARIVKLGVRHADAEVVWSHRAVAVKASA